MFEGNMEFPIKDSKEVSDGKINGFFFFQGKKTLLLKKKSLLTTRFSASGGSLFRVVHPPF